MEYSSVCGCGCLNVLCVCDIFAIADNLRVALHYIVGVTAIATIIFWLCKLWPSRSPLFWSAASQSPLREWRACVGRGSVRGASVLWVYSYLVVGAGRFALRSTAGLPKQRQSDDTLSLWIIRCVGGHSDRGGMRGAGLGLGWNQEQCAHIQ